MGSGTSIAIVDGDPLYSSELAAQLSARGFDVLLFKDGKSFLMEMQNGIQPRVVLVDWTVGTHSGLQVLRALRERSPPVPVVFLTRRAPVERELAALRSGALDFVDKDRGIDILAPRLRRLIGPEQIMHTPRHRGALALNAESSRATWRGRDVDLTVSEYKVVELIAMAGGTVVMSRTIYDNVHYKGFIGGVGARGYEVNVRGIMKRIRRKFLAIDPGFACLPNRRGRGYYWAERGQATPLSTEAHDPASGSNRARLALE